MDRGVGNLTAALRKQGMWDTTLVIFQSDNGAASHGSNWPLRGGKCSIWEGGTVGDALITGPGILQQNYPYGWGADTPPYLDPTVDHNWYILPPGYSYHMETATWAVTPRDPNDLETLGR